MNHGIASAKLSCNRLINQDVMKRIISRHRSSSPVNQYWSQQYRRVTGQWKRSCARGGVRLTLWQHKYGAYPTRTRTQPDAIPISFPFGLDRNLVGSISDCCFVMLGLDQSKPKPGEWMNRTNQTFYAYWSHAVPSSGPMQSSTMQKIWLSRHKATRVKQPLYMNMLYMNMRMTVSAWEIRKSIAKFCQITWPHPASPQ